MELKKFVHKRYERVNRNLPGVIQTFHFPPTAAAKRS